MAALLGCYRKGRIAAAGAEAIRFGTAIEQERRHTRMTILRCDKERRIARSAGATDVNPML
ncbi:unnamed protein product [marine sediment metagenome]|uniref:Uncharacterized protein n=1 Tax=marine sediment metagenome TaxID=412755 RepID=X0VXL1_9ZZZZ